MFKKVKELLVKLKAKREEKVKAKNMQDYYKKLQNGALVLQYIHKDMAEQKKKMNRQQRRRFDVEMSKKGKFSIEVINRYMTQINQINAYIDKKLGKKK